MVTKKQKVIGWIKVLRPKFLISYILLGIGGIVIGIHAGNEINNPLLALSFITILLAGVGVHFRDEASDWLAGYDVESGGVGVIREGILGVKSLQNVGRILTGISLVFAILNVFLVWQLIFIIIPIAIVIVASNYLTERISLGHEIAPAFAYTMALLWVYMGQGWNITISTIWFATFAFLFVLALVPYQDVGDYKADLKSGKKTLTVKLGIDAVGQLSILIAVVSLIFLYLSILTMSN
jgi:4-hydroxybenzoate polyprenyltransferase